MNIIIMYYNNFFFIWKCINNGENNMYQLGLQVKMKKAKGWRIYFFHVKH